MRVIFILFYMFLLFPIYSLDVVYLKNDDKISGSIVEMTKTNLIIETEYGTLKIDRAYVNKAEISSTLLKEKNDVDVFDGFLLKYSFNNSVQNSSEMKVEQSVFGTPLFEDGINKDCLYSKKPGSYVKIKNNEKLSSYNNFTLCFWIKPEDFDRTQYICSQWTSTQNKKATGKLAVSFAKNILIIYLVGSQGLYYTYTLSNCIEYNKWQFIMITKAISKLSIYKNNTLLKEFNLPFNHLKTDQSDLLMLTAKYGKNNYKRYNFVGCIDQFYLFDRILSSNEIKTLYDNKQE